MLEKQKLKTQKYENYYCIETDEILKMLKIVLGRNQEYVELVNKSSKFETQ